MSEPEHGMARDQRDDWPDEDPNTPGYQLSPGKYDIDLTTVEGYPGVTAHLTFVCPHGKVCGLLMAPQPIPRSDERRLYVWGWDGNTERPTLTPSILCLTPQDGKQCGWHGYLTTGELRSV